MEKLRRNTNQFHRLLRIIAHIVKQHDSNSNVFAPCTSMTALQKACGGSLVTLESQLFRKHR